MRIPYQQKRMFGFVTFVFAETVKQILTKGNPHFVCGARVLVKPYREKSRLIDRLTFGLCKEGNLLFYTFFELAVPLDFVCHSLNLCTAQCLIFSTSQVHDTGTTQAITKSYLLLDCFYLKSQ